MSKLNPDHYSNHNIEPIEVTEDWDLGFHQGNILKYLCRAGKKSNTDELTDLKKARWYLNRIIRKLEKEQEEENSDPKPGKIYVNPKPPHPSIDVGVLRFSDNSQWEGELDHVETDRTDPC